jgi:hypothetical protein
LEKVNHEFYKKYLERHKGATDVVGSIDNRNGSGDLPDYGCRDASGGQGGSICAGE